MTTLSNLLWVIIPKIFVRISVVSSNIGSLTVPKSSVVLIGDEVRLKCSVNGRDLATWAYTARNKSTERPRYKLDKELIEHDLKIGLVHAGRYRFTAALQHTLWNDMQLTVFGNYRLTVANYLCSSLKS